MIKLIEFNQSNFNNEDWDNFVESSDNGTIFHRRDFLAYHPKTRFKDNSLVFLKDKKIFSVFPAVDVELNGARILYSHRGASYGSFVYHSDLNIKDAFNLVEILIDYARKKNFDRIILTLPPIIYCTRFSNYIDFALYRSGFEYLKREISSTVSLDFDDEKLLNTFRPEARTALKKALKMGVEVAETDKFEEYYEILKKNLKMRHNVNPTHSLEELLKLKSTFPTKIRLFGAFVKSRLIAGVCNFSANSKVVLAFYISHDEAYQEYRPVNLLFYEIMRRYKYEGFKYLDFGIFTVNMEPNWGLGRFKENFGARGIFRDTFQLILK